MPAVRLLTSWRWPPCPEPGPVRAGVPALIGVPGFSFFRAPARWSLATALALAILAGKGFDRWRDWPRPGRWLRWLVDRRGRLDRRRAGPARAGGAEHRRTPGWPRAAGWFDAAFKAHAVDGDPSFDEPDPSFRDVMARRASPRAIPTCPLELPAVGRAPEVGGHPEPRGPARTIYLRELWETALWLVLIAIAAGPDRPDDRRPRAAPALLLLLTFLDLWVLGRHRLIDVGPIRPLAEQSPVLARLAAGASRDADRLEPREPADLVGRGPDLGLPDLDLPAVESLDHGWRWSRSTRPFEPMRPGGAAGDRDAAAGLRPGRESGSTAS